MTTELKDMKILSPLSKVTIKNMCLTSVIVQVNITVLFKLAEIKYSRKFFSNATFDQLNTVPVQCTVYICYFKKYTFKSNRERVRAWAVDRNFMVINK